MGSRASWSASSPEGKPHLRAFSRRNRGSLTSHRRLLSAGLCWLSSGWEMGEVTEISTSFIASGLLLLKPRSPRNEMKPFLKTEAAVAQLRRRKHLFKKQFLWPVTFCKPPSPPVFQILVFEQECSPLILECCQTSVLQTGDGRGRGPIPASF